MVVAFTLYTKINSVPCTWAWMQSRVPLRGSIKYEAQTPTADREHRWPYGSHDKPRVSCCTYSSKISHLRKCCLRLFFTTLRTCQHTFNINNVMWLKWFESRSSPTLKRPVKNNFYSYGSIGQFINLKGNRWIQLEYNEWPRCSCITLVVAIVDSTV